MLVSGGGGGLWGEGLGRRDNNNEEGNIDL